ncbi:MAG: sigma-70 family RNA polymerase sigma factor [Gemmatimonadota bacterium]
MEYTAPTTDADRAIPALLAAHGDNLYALALRLCGEEEAAKDLVQETFMRAFRGWDGFQGRSKASTWLYTIAVRSCQRMHRRRAGEPARLEPLDRLLPSGDEGILQIPSDDDPAADAERHEASEAVLGALRALPLEFRLPLVLKEMADFSIAEIAETLDVKAPTVKTRLHRARLRVRQELANALPTRPAPPPDHAREECLALIRAKQESLDHDTEFPLSNDLLCDRCSAVFLTLDYGRAVCRALSSGRMPQDLRRSIGQALSQD